MRDVEVPGDRLPVGSAPAFATRITAVVMAGFLGVAFVYLLLDDPKPIRSVPAALALIAMFALQIGVISNPARDPTGRTGLAALAGQIAICALAVEYGYGWLGLLGFVAGSVVLVLPRSARWPAFALVSLIGLVLITVLTEVDLLTRVYSAVATIGTGLIVFGLTRLRQIAVELDRTRVAAGELATAQERLRLAGNLHATTGHRLSTMAQRTLLARRLLDLAPDRAVVEITGIVAMARAALADVRTTASRYRTPTLEHEVAAARSTLDAAGIRTTVRSDGPEIPSDVGAVIVTALRAAVDDVLRSGDARRCELTLSGGPDRAALEVVDDGTHAGRCAGGPSLTERVALAGGTVRGAAAGPDCYGFRVEVGLPPDASTGPVPQPASAPRVPNGLVPRFALWVLVAVLVAYAVNGVYFVFFADPSTGAAVLGIAAVLAMLALQLGVITPRRVRDRYRRAAVAAQAGIVALSVAVLDDAYVGLPGFLAGSVLLVLPRRIRWVVFAVVVAAVGVLQAVLTGTTDGVVYGLAATVNHGLVIYGLTCMRDLVDDLQVARADVANLAVTRERLRFARDLHDLLGYGLSAITLKTELAARLVAPDTARARRELDDVLGVIGQSLTDVRSVAGSQQPLDLQAEVASARSVLCAAGVDVVLAPDPLPDLGAIPRTPGTVLATVLREAVTNLLRHSDALACAITLERVDDRVRMEIVNDGMRPATGPPGSGLANLAARAADLGGALAAGPEGHDRFAVQVTVPAGCADALIPTVGVATGAVAAGAVRGPFGAR